MIVFSKSTQLLFERVYPQLKTKIKIIAHQVSPLPVVTVAPHKTVNIGFLGGASNVAKGKKVIEQICAQNTDPNTTFTVIGPYDKPSTVLNVSGEYRREDLPKLIKKYQLDIIFIPSIVPETFSYTTTEAMDMGLPVACYNMGAPAERVAGYKKGLVLNEINPKQNLQEIISFVLKNRKEN